jgi:hypothetical protein
MALQKQKFNISFAGGIDQKTDDKQVIPGKLLSLENGVLTKIGKVIKRNGYGVIAYPLARGNSLATFQNELIAYDGTSAYSYAESINTWNNKGPLNVVSIFSNQIVRNTYQQINGDSAIHPSGLEVYTWDDSRGGSRYSCIDKATGQIVVFDAQIASTASKAKPIVLGQYVVIFYYDSAVQRVRALPVPVLTPDSPLSPFDVAIVSVADPNFDAAQIGQRAFIAYNTNATSVEIVYINAFLQAATPTAFAGEVADGCITVFGDEVNNAVVGYYDGTDVKYLVTDYELVQITAPTTIETIADIKNITGICTNQNPQFWYTKTAAQTYNNLIRTASVDFAGTVFSTGVLLRSVSIASKAFLFSGVPYLATVFDTVLQPTIFVINGNGVVVAKFAPQVAGGTIVNNMLPNFATVDGVNWYFAFTKKDQLDSVSGAVFTQTGISNGIMRFNSDDSFEDVVLANNLHVSGGILQMYDGTAFVEHNFNYYPENFTVTEAGGGSISAGIRQYVVTYEWLDNQGQLHRSTTSVPLSFTNTGGSKINTLVVPTLRLTEKRATNASVQIVVYRTIDLGTIFYQVTSITSPVYNDTTVNTVSITDNVSDSALVGNNLLYTTGGVADNTQAAGTNIIASVRGRVFYVPAENPYSYNFSKIVSPNLPVEFYDQAPYEIDRRGGRITAITALDDKIVFFKENAVFYLVGEGPDATGAQNDYTEAQLITTDGGCVDPSSVVTFPLGLMYKSAKGIYMLNRGLNIEYIGKEVEDYNGNNIYAATLVNNKNQVRFALDNGIVLVYDYLVGQWYTFTNHNYLFDATNWQNKYAYIRTDGQVWVENEGYSDNGSPISMRIRTAWMSLGQLQGFQRIYKAMVLGTYVSKHQLVMSVAYDFNPYVFSSVTIDAYSLIGVPNYGDFSPYGAEQVYGGNYPLYQFRYLIPRQKCEAVQFMFEDTQNDTTGEGYQLSGLAVEVGIKQGLNKLGPTRTFS